MYAVMLVDDEPAILNSLLKAIPWKEYGFYQVCTASDGAEALQLLEKNNFDLLITDIRMPNMDGLELLRNVHRRRAHTRFVILSAYDEFEYVLEALHMGAENYLLKPINTVELSATIEKALDNIRKSRKNQIGPVNSEEIFSQNLLSRWVSGDIYGQELSERANIAGINIFSRTYCVVIARELSGDGLSKTLGSRMAEVLSASYDCYHFTDSNGSQVLILGGYDVIPSQIKNLIQSIPGQFSRSVFFIAIGTKALGSAEVGASYKSANDIIRFRMLFSHNTVVISEEVQKPGFNKLALNYVEFCRILREGDREEVQEAVQTLMRRIFEHTSDSIPATKALVIELLLHVTRETEKCLMPGQELPPSLQNLFNHLDFISTSTELFDWVGAVISDARRTIQGKEQNVSPVVNRTIQYVRKHFNQPLSIKTLSDIMGVNSSYLGYLFKKETGLYFSNYINQIRIQTSESLLLDTDMNIQDIAVKVGYSEVSYFIQIFNKVHGVSPAKFRQIYGSGQL